MDIYVFKRADGSEWADYRAPKGAAVVQHISATKVVQIAEIAKRSDRVGALAERRLKEIMTSTIEPQRVLDAQIEVSVRERRFFSRLKWLLTGK